MRRLALLAVLPLAACSKAPTGAAPHQIHIAGSSAGYLLSTQVAERLMREDPDVLAPLVRAGGTGEGIARFCDKDNPTRPDILITTRKMTAEEQARCAADGSTDIEQKWIGDTTVMAVKAKDGSPPPFGDTADLVKALTSNAKTWAEVRSGLPAKPIVIHGPTPTPAIADTLYGPILKDDRPVRTDGAYTGHGADADMVARIVADKPGAIGIMPYPQALTHHDTLTIVALSNVKAFPLFLVSRPRDVSHVPGLSRLLGYYGDALSHERDDIFPEPPKPIKTADAKL